MISLSIVLLFGKKEILSRLGWWVMVSFALFVILYWHSEAISLYWERFASIVDWTEGRGNIGRTEVWRDSLAGLVSTYFIGQGPASTGNAAVRLGLLSSSGVTESSYLKLLLELGVLGFAIFALLYYRFTASCNRLISHSKDATEHWLIVSTFAVLIGLAAEMAIYQSIETQIGQGLMWFLFAIVVVLARGEKTDVKQLSDQSL